MLINTFFPPVSVGGAEKSVYELSAGLSAAGLDVAVACLGPSGHKIVEDPPAGVCVYRKTTEVADPWFGDREVRTKASKAMWHFGEYRRPNIGAFLRAAVADFKPTIVHTNSIAGFGIEAWRCAQDLPVVHTMREYHLLCISSRTYRDNAACGKQCAACNIVRIPFRLTPHRPDVFVGLSQATIDRHKEWGYIGNNDRTAIIPNRPQVHFRAGVDVAPGLQVYGFIGRIERYKGVEVLLEAFRRFTRSDARLVIAGDGNSTDLRNLRSAIGDDSRISFLGCVPQKEFYAQVNVVFVPSQWHEPYGRVAVEALEAGAAVAVSAIGGLPEAVLPYANHVIVDNYQSSDAWLDTMKYLEAYSPLTASEDVAPNEDMQSVEGSYMSLYRDLALVSK